MLRQVGYLMSGIAGFLLLLLIALVVGVLYFLLLPSSPPGPKAVVPLEQLSETLQGQLWRVERIIDLLTLMMAVGTIVLGFGALLGYTIVRDWIGNTAQSVAERQAKQAADEVYNDALARSISEEAYIHWRISSVENQASPELSDAIRRAEQALREIDRLRESQDPAVRANRLQLRTNLLTNLAYYYAQVEMREKEGLARKYSTWAREQIHTVSYPPPTALIANDIYVRLRFGNSRPELQTVREDLVKHLAVYAGDRAFCDELREYQNALDQKIKDLSRGP